MHPRKRAESESRGYEVAHSDGLGNSWHNEQVAPRPPRGLWILGDVDLAARTWGSQAWIVRFLWLLRQAPDPNDCWHAGPVPEVSLEEVWAGGDRQSGYARYHRITSPVSRLLAYK